MPSRRAKQAHTELEASVQPGPCGQKHTRALSSTRLPTPLYKYFSAAYDGCLQCVEAALTDREVGVADLSYSGAYNALSWAEFGEQEGQKDTAAVQSFLKARGLEVPETLGKREWKSHRQHTYRSEGTTVPPTPRLTPRPPACPPPARLLAQGQQKHEQPQHAKGQQDKGPTDEEEHQKQLTGQQKRQLLQTKEEQAEGEEEEEEKRERRHKRVRADRETEEEQKPQETAETEQKPRLLHAPSSSRCSAAQPIPQTWLPQRSMAPVHPAARSKAAAMMPPMQRRLLQEQEREREKRYLQALLQQVHEQEQLLQQEPRHI